MKKFISSLILMLTVVVSANSMSYAQARQQALFLTDKMAYELNLNEAQYEAAYEINLDYLMGINTPDDLYGAYWRQRNLDLSYILLDWQYRTFCAAAYFYRPLYWSLGNWHFRIYAHYPHRDFFYFGHPKFVMVYRGGHSWRCNGGKSWYYGKRLKPKHTKKYFGMRDGFKRGDYGKGFKGSFGSKHNNGLGNKRFESGTGTFGNRGGSLELSKFANSSSSKFGGSRNGVTLREVSKIKDTFSPEKDNGSKGFKLENKRPESTGVFGGNRIGNSRTTTITNSRDMIPNGSNKKTALGGNRGMSSFGHKISPSKGKNANSSFGRHLNDRASFSSGKAKPNSSSGSGGGSFGGRR